MTERTDRSDVLIARAEVVVDADAASAFELFVSEIGLWWRTGTPYWNDPENAKTIRLERGVGGRFLEVHDLDTGAGFEVGRVRTWEPPNRLVFTWTQVGWPAEPLTEVEVTFEPQDDERTLVRVEHRGFERLADPSRYVAGYDLGWKAMLGWFGEHVARLPADNPRPIDEKRKERQ